jgi:vacuolar-type H+-ATPase subunit F/Vma7
LWVKFSASGGVLNSTANKTNKDRGKIKKIISRIMKRFKVIAINEEILTKALSSEIDDFEDVVIEISSKENDAEYILTKNIKDFKKYCQTNYTGRIIGNFEKQ